MQKWLFNKLEPSRRSQQNKTFLFPLGKTSRKNWITSFEILRTQAPLKIEWTIAEDIADGSIDGSFVKD